VASVSGPPNPWPTIGKLVGALVATGILTAGLLLPYVGGLGLAARHEADKFLATPCNLQESQPPLQTRMYASDGKTVLATLFTQDRRPVPLSQIPKQLQQALVATEDRRFYSHHGVDMRGLLRSAVSTSSGDTQGGSTLTMQYVKQMRYYQAGKDVKAQQAAIDQNLNRKIEDAKCAIYIENTEHESKDQILDNYLNIAFFGENSYGIQTAAQTYFNKDAAKLSLPESAMLVGLLRAPTEYDPFVHPEAAKKRRNEVLQNLVAMDHISQRVADKYKTQPVSLATTAPPLVKEGCANANSSVRNVGFFCDYAVHWLETTGGISDSQLTTGGLKIITTLNANLQNSMQTHVESSLPASSAMTAVLPAVDPQTGNVLAMATSKKYGTNASKNDHSHTSLPIFTAYSGQGASTYKLFPLLTALQTGVPSGWQLSTPAGGPYRPNNCATSDGVSNGDALETYSATETLTSATVKSSNTFFVGLADQLLGCHLSPIVDTAKRLGMKSLTQPSGDGRQTVEDTIVNYQRPGELVLGDVGTSPLELAGAYAAVANAGKFNKPAPIQSITDSKGRQITVKRSPPVQAVSPWVAMEAVNILAGDTKYPGTSAVQFQPWYQQGLSTVAGKTGTSVAVVNGKDTTLNSSLWFVGMTPKLVATSAVVNFDHPNAPAAGLPNQPNASSTAYGAYAAGIWVKALTPSLASQRWAWPDAASAPGQPVPSVVGLSVAAAKQKLAESGYKMSQLGHDPNDPVLCASNQPMNMIAYAGPQIAPRGATITVCPSSAQRPSVYIPPKPSHRNTPSGNTSHSGGGHVTPPGHTPPPRHGGGGGGGGGRHGGGLPPGPGH
jgi:membrane peptidoglycan carboxypeptidase